jgi:hypothetical protein
MERTVHGVTWKDPLAWMEDTKGKKWKDFIETEQYLWQGLVEKTKPSLRKQIESELKGYNAVGEAFVLGSQGIQVSMQGKICWKFENKAERKAVDIDFCKEFPGFVWAVEETESSQGAEHYALRCYVKEKKEPVWKHDTPIAPHVAVVNGRVFCVEARLQLVYYRVVSYNALTGDDRRVHYEEHDKRYNLEMIRCDCDTVYIRRQAGEKQDVLWFGGKKSGVCESSSLESRRFVLGNHRDCYFVWEQHFGWKMSKGLVKHGFQFPNITRSMTPESLDCERGLFVTKWKGERTLWKISKTKPAQNLWQGMGTVGLDPYGSKMIRIVQPGQEIIWWQEGQPIPELKRYDTTYMDTPRGTRCIIVQPKVKPVGLLVCGYGAYGLPTPLRTARWEPLLTRGWIVAIGLWRGGGDHTPDWEDSGRRHGREEVLKDVEEAVLVLQKKLLMKPSQTVIFGRSAGGLWVGGLVAKHAKGGLFGGAYMEVPYLDVLRTTTNHALPLTDIETDEFGLPSQRISDFVSILKWSPMENVPVGGVKGVWQIVRTGLNDKQVYPYEAAKWVVRCGEKAYLAVEGGQGHFVSGSVGLQQQAEDLAVLLHLASN